MLIDMLGTDTYRFIEAENGREAVMLLDRFETDIDLLLLDIAMPEMDGLSVLAAMHETGSIESTPVIMISAESSAQFIERSYDLGAVDYISRPFLPLAVARRVENTLLLFSKQKQLEELVVRQMDERNRTSSLMVNILSNIVEFRNGESGNHVLRIRSITKILLEALIARHPHYKVTPSDIVLITEASAMHDIGKIVVPEEILNKPGKLTDEEFAIMKTHTIKASEMLEQVRIGQDEPLMHVIRDICRWHHERYDGTGYPDGLTGESIPLSAQIVSLADVYDALVSERVYKPAFASDVAVDMILNGECGVFNPDLLDCLASVKDDLERNVSLEIGYEGRPIESHVIAQEFASRQQIDASTRTLVLLEQERAKYQFLASLSDGILFEYNAQTDLLTLSENGAELWSKDPVIVGALSDPEHFRFIEERTIQQITDAIEATTPENPIVEKRVRIAVSSGEERWFNLTLKTLWMQTEVPERIGSIGRITDINASMLELENLKRIAQQDPLTGLLNRNAAQKAIDVRLEANACEAATFVMVDIDNFRRANNSHGYMFGDSVLSFVSHILEDEFQDADILARIGGDEFIVYLEQKLDPHDMDATTARICSVVSAQYADLSLSISFGISRAPHDGTAFEALFIAADKALFASKQLGGNRWTSFSAELEEFKSTVSEIEH